MVAGIGSIGRIPELRKRILFTIGMLAVYRLGVFVSTPGVDVAKLKAMFNMGNEALFGLVNMFSGGALENFSIFTLGIAPYISVSIILQLLGPTIPAIDQLKKEGEVGKRVLTRYTRIGTILLALFQGYMISLGLVNKGLAITSGFQFYAITAISLTAGTAFMMWLGEQITEKGIGNGVSILIFAGIVARMPSVLVDTIVKARTGAIDPFTILLAIAISLLTIFLIVLVERSFRRIPVSYPRRMVGRNVTQAQTQYMPLKVNMAGVIPPIFASALLVIPSYIVAFSSNELVQEIVSYVSPGTWGHDVIFAGLILVFSFFYTTIIFNPDEVADNLKKNGGFVPLVRPGKQTSEYLMGVISRLTIWGALYIAVICIIPNMAFMAMGVSSFSYVFGGTAVLIAVGVTIDTASQIESIVTARNYEAIMSKSTKLRGVGSMSYNRNRLLRR